MVAAIVYAENLARAIDGELIKTLPRPHLREINRENEKPIFFFPWGTFESLLLRDVRTYGNTIEGAKH